MRQFWSAPPCVALLVLWTGGIQIIPALAADAPPAVAHDVAAYGALGDLPDWSGAWAADPQPSVLKTNASIPLTDKYASQLTDLRKKIKAGGAMPSNPNCRPLGLPLSMSQIGPLHEILFAPGHVFINSEAQEVRDIHTDGRKLPDDVAIDGFNGLSIGHWEGDTLVVQTIGILPDVDIVSGIQNGGGLNVLERIHLMGPNKLQDEITLSDAKSLAEPYSYTINYSRHREWSVAEDVCITASHAIYKLEGYKPTVAEENASSQNKKPVRTPVPAMPPPTKADWEAIAQLPDWTGWWSLNSGSNELHTREAIPLTPPYQRYRDKLEAIEAVGGDYVSDIYHCRPRGAPQMMKAAGGGWFFAFTPGQVTMVPNNGQTRRFYTDGRMHPTKLELSFNGHSIAHWEGDTLVVDTVGLRPDMQMFYAMPAGDGLHMVERFHSIAPNRIEVVTTQDSKLALTAPWTYKRTMTRHPDQDLLEDYCAQNNRDVDSVTGMQTFNLTPPPEDSDSSK